MASSVAPLAFGARAPARTSRGAFRLPAHACRAVAVGRVAPPLRSRCGGTTLGSLASSSAPAATDASSGASVDLLGLRGGGADAAAAAAAVFERVDDVVMGGVSSSTIAPDPAGRECLVWAGKCRAEGGGFAGARSVSLQTPLDLSSFDGLALTCGFESDAEPERRTWKATVRTQNDRGEMVYQATFTPPVVDAANGKTPRETRIPWNAFRLVRGPTVVPDVPPLSASQCGEVYGLGLIMSRFGARGPMPEFREGPFRLAVHAFGVYSATKTFDEIPETTTLLDAASTNLGKRASENRGTRNVVTFLLSPLIKLAFDEKRRRRKRARDLLKKRFGVGAFRARFSFGQKLKTKRRGGDGLGAAAEGARELIGDIVASGLTLPLRLVFILLAKFARLVRAVKGQKQLPKMR